jgi:hyperpolarization activated cyclic nucleotide-gated potassium channel 2
MFLDYAKFWFWVDLISSIPFTWFLEGFENSNLTGGTSRAPKLVKLMKISKILKILKLLRLMKLKKLMERFDDYFVSYQSDFILTFSMILLKILIFIHYMGCVFYYAGDYSQNNVGNSWIEFKNITDADLGTL